MIPREAGVGEGREVIEDWEGREAGGGGMVVVKKQTQTDGRDAVRYFDSASFPLSFPRRSRAVFGIMTGIRKLIHRRSKTLFVPSRLKYRERKRRSQIEICPPSFHLVCCSRTSTKSVASSKTRNERPQGSFPSEKRKETPPRKNGSTRETRSKPKPWKHENLFGFLSCLSLIETLF